MNTKMALLRLAQKKEGLNRTIEMVKSLPIGKPCKFFMRFLQQTAVNTWRDGSCVAIPVSFNTESVNLKIICSDLGYPVTGYSNKVYSRNRDGTCSINFRRITGWQEFINDPLLCMQYSVKTKLLEDMLKEGRDGKVAEQKGSGKSTVGVS
jgi:hypothetical protein